MQRIKFWFKNRDYSWRYKLRICLPLILGLIAIDWISKFTIMKSMKYGSSADFLPKFLRLNYVINLGSARGANADNLALAVSLATLFTFSILIIFIFVNNRKWMIALSFINGGGLGNLLGRSWTPTLEGANTRGGVIDFLQWDFNWLGGNQYIFNLADVFVITGSALLVIFLIFEIWQSLRKPRPINPPTKTEVVQEKNRETH